MPEYSLFQPDETPHVVCPYCGSSETEFFSLFGAQLLTAQYYCRACHTPFEQIKNADVLADAARRDLAGAQAEERGKE
jgi:ring-1,2-phenylacetyl-CoA epoxidase subunit PaaD